jgi:hypothetical protein
MKVGDLVKFSAPSVFNPAAARYAPTGIVVGVSDPKDGPRPHRPSYTVVWHAIGDQYKRTTEWGCYLERLG